MKKIILTLMILTLAFTTQAQNCKYKTDGIDKATGKQTKLTKSKMIWNVPFKSDVLVSLKKVDADYSVMFVYELVVGGSSAVANKDAELIFVLQDGTEVNLKRGNEKDIYPITKEQMDSMMKSKVSTVRYYYTNIKTNEYTHQPFYQVTDDEAKDLQELVQCINK